MGLGQGNLAGDPNDARVAGPGQSKVVTQSDGSTWISNDMGAWVQSGYGESSPLKSKGAQKPPAITNNNTTVVAAPQPVREMAAQTGLPNPGASWGKDYHTSFGTRA